MLDLRGGVALGMFISGCVAGGGDSNMFTYLLGGDLSLSVTLTLVNLLASLGKINVNLFVTKISYYDIGVTTLCGIFEINFPM